MSNKLPSARSAVLAASVALALSACASAPQFGAKDVDFNGRVSVVDTPVVLAGKPVTLQGQSFKPGQQVTLSYGGAKLGDTVTADAEGKFRSQFVLPATAEAGRYSLVASAANPGASLLVPLKISPDVALSGADKFSSDAKPLVPGLYQVAYSAKSDRLFVTATSRGGSTVVKVNPQTLAIEGRATPPAAPAPTPRPGAAPAPANAPAPVFSVFGVGVDDANGNVWATNTRQNTIAVYRQSDLSLVKQYPLGAVPHARDVVIDQKVGKAYSSATGNPFIVVFDAKTLGEPKRIALTSSVRGRDAKEFSPMSLALDEAGGRLFTVSMTTNEIAVIDTKTDTVTKTFVVDGTATASGVAYDSKNDRILVASQGSDNLVAVDAKTGKVVFDTKVGAGSLNVTYEPVRGLAYVSNRAAGTVTVVDANGKIVGNLSGGTLPQHLDVDGKGAVFAVNKSRGENDEAGDRIARISAR
ncbi:MAG: hypothetical protein REI94_20575 [Moraxellaceae bacterium]|nr:hypothetical protein [Moraxellaceae bacterium]